MSDKKPRNFFERPESEQQEFLKHTWCNQCMEADLGMSDPVEYQLGNRIFIEGRCTKCGQPVVTELVEEDSDEV